MKSSIINGSNVLLYVKKHVNSLLETEKEHFLLWKNNYQYNPAFVISSHIGSCSGWSRIGETHKQELRVDTLQSLTQHETILVATKDVFQQEFKGSVNKHGGSSRFSFSDIEITVSVRTRKASKPYCHYYQFVLSEKLLFTGTDIYKDNHLPTG